MSVFLADHSIEQQDLFINSIYADCVMEAIGGTTKNL